MVIPKTPDVSLKEIIKRPVSTWKELMVNDFEETVFAKYPQLAAIKRSLYDSGAVYASMSGSGSALFALYRK
jgi:4-diphosphocytidyl-2-C-methyl-D-erythritol kinase